MSAPGLTRRRVLALAALALLGGCGKKVSEPVYEPQKPPAPPRDEAKPIPKGTFKPYTVDGKTYYPLGAVDGGWEEEGLASWYGPGFHTQKTSSGETYNMYDLTCAHKVLPMQTRVRITNLETGKSADLRVNDRGPFVSGRVVDLSLAAAQRLGVYGPGVAKVRLTVLGGAGMSREEVVQAVARGAYYVQVGAFTVRDNALRLQKDLKAAGYAATRVQEAVVDGVRYWRVQAGAFAGMENANEGLRRLSAKYQAGFIIAD